MEFVLRVDRKGRVVVPKRIREKLNLNEHSFLKIYLDGSRIIMEPIYKVKKVKAKAMKEAFFDAGQATFGE